MKFDILSIFPTFSRKFKFHRNQTRITCTLCADQYTFFITSQSVLLRMRHVSDNVTDKTKTHILCSIPFYSKILPFMR